MRLAELRQSLSLLRIIQRAAFHCSRESPNPEAGGAKGLVLGQNVSILQDCDMMRLRTSDSRILLTTPFCSNRDCLIMLLFANRDSVTALIIVVFAEARSIFLSA